ncbi:signal peptidase I [Saccharomonospora iraqiensis]|uniref:signal peptidase I n=1 Tax=Saccharomonospora iraqiensis TaxID=52698 RepID=UPI001F3C81C0|nr:signal peptidase I [Saccharomonospora iraqiensis]
MVESVPSNAAEDEPERPEDGSTPKDGSTTSSGDDGRTTSSREDGESAGRSGTEDGSSPAAGAHPEKGRADKQRSFWKELPILIVVALVLAFLIQQFLGRVYMIPSGSMEETLHGCPGCTPDRILVDKVTYHFTDPAPGDVVVFRGPQPWVEDDPPLESANPVAQFFQNVGSAFGLAPPDERDFVKRIIATGGQTVQCCDDRNRVVVDGRPLDEPYVYWEGGDREQEDFGPVRVPEGTVWVMGDNRNNSSDSRYQGGGGPRGAVPVDNIIGKARLIVLPPSRWGVVSDHNPQQEPVAAAPVAPAAPTWQQGLPLGVGAAASWPVLRAGRRAATAVGTCRRAVGSVEREH